MQLFCSVLSRDIVKGYVITVNGGRGECVQDLRRSAMMYSTNLENLPCIHYISICRCRRSEGDRVSCLPERSLPLLFTFASFQLSFFVAVFFSVRTVRIFSCYNRFVSSYFIVISTLNIFVPWRTVYSTQNMIYLLSLTYGNWYDRPLNLF